MSEGIVRGGKQAEEIGSITVREGFCHTHEVCFPLM